MEVCVIFFDKHPTDKSPLLSPLKCILIWDNPGESSDPLFFMNQRNQPFISYQQPQNPKPYYAPFGGKYYVSTGWAPMGPNQPLVQSIFQ